jgi:hypothetical protein
MGSRRVWSWDERRKRSDGRKADISKMVRVAFSTKFMPFRSRTHVPCHHNFLPSMATPLHSVGQTTHTRSPFTPYRRVHRLVISRGYVRTRQTPSTPYSGATRDIAEHVHGLDHHEDGSILVRHPLLPDMDYRTLYDHDSSSRYDRSLRAAETSRFWRFWHGSGCWSMGRCRDAFR